MIEVLFRPLDDHPYVGTCDSCKIVARFTKADATMRRHREPHVLDRLKQPVEQVGVKCPECPGGSVWSDSNWADR